MDLIGTVVLPLLMIFLSPGISRFMIGWAKPVPVNPYNLNQPRRDDILVTLAGPAMNLILAVLLMALARAGILFHSAAIPELCVQAAALSLLLCFFNLIPIPPLDGSQVMRVLTNMSFETYANFARYGFIAVIIVLQIPAVRYALSVATYGTLSLLGSLFGVN